MDLILNGFVGGKECLERPQVWLVYESLFVYSGSWQTQNFNYKLLMQIFKILIDDKLIKLNYCFNIQAISHLKK